MPAGTATRPHTDVDLDAWERDDFLIVRGLLREQEIADLSTTFDELHERGSINGCFQALPVDEARAQGDMLKAYPRMMHPHRVNDVACRFMLHPGVAEVLRRGHHRWRTVWHGGQRAALIGRTGTTFTYDRTP